MTMTAEEWQARLARQENAWRETEAATGSIFDDPPDGDYQFTVYSFDFIEVTEGQNAGAFLKINLQVANGPHQGKVTGELFALEDPGRLQYTKGALAVLGVDVESTPLSAIHPGSPVLEAVLDVPVEGTVKRSQKVNPKTGQPYVNVYINKRLGPPLRAEQPAQQSLPASPQQSDVTTEADQQAFAQQPHPAGDDAPWSSEDLAAGPGGAQTTTGQGAPGCTCPNYPNHVDNNCPVPGHKIDF